MNGRDLRNPKCVTAVMDADGDSGWQCIQRISVIGEMTTYQLFSN